jgi:acetyl esterase/lipase
MNDMQSGNLVRHDPVEAPDAEGVYRIWPGTAPGSETWDWSERTIQVPWSDLDRRVTRNVADPTVTVFRPPAAKANGTAMIVAPGGGFNFLMVDHEGYDMARWLNELGITAFVLKYRLGRTPDADDDLHNNIAFIYFEFFLC